MTPTKCEPINRFIFKAHKNCAKLSCEDGIMSIDMKIFLTSGIVTLLGFFALQFPSSNRSIVAYVSALVFLAGFVGVIVSVMLMIWS